MSFVERIMFAIAGAFMAGAVVMAMTFWTDTSQMGMLLKIFIPAGAVGGFFLGQQFFDFLKDLFHKIW